MTLSKVFEERSINTIRFLSTDAIQKANSGHPGLPMGAAALTYTLWMRHLSFNPKNPIWHNRDRFILSGGHGSMLLYAMLFLTGYELSLDEIKHFRQWGSHTPGHPEFGVTPGVEVTTGPLGQGISNAVGMAVAEAHLASIFNKPDLPVIDHYTYVLATDGDLMEGIASEASSLAGHLKLGKLIVLYDDNRISIEGSTDIAFTENRGARYEAYGWQVLYVSDGNEVDAIDQAIRIAKNDDRPSLIICRTRIGYGLPNKQDTAGAHGEPPGEKELKAAKDNQNWPWDPWFYVPDDVLAHFREVIPKGIAEDQEWQELAERYRTMYPDLGKELARRLDGRLPSRWDSDLLDFPGDEKGLATRAVSGKVLNSLAERLPELMGGSADLAPSTKTWIDGSPAFQARAPEGRNIHFGVREHAMGAIVNGLAVHGGIIPFGATFLVFSDYMRPAIRLSALSNYPSIWVFTHDSIGLGEDGPTHQPIEHLAALRAIPNLVVIRPCDANEVVEAWKFAVKHRDGATALAFTRQAVPTLDRSIYGPASGLERGAYVLADYGDQAPEIILMASGSEVDLVVRSAGNLAAEGINVRIVSFPSWELFGEQDQEYQDSVLLPEVNTRIAVEAGVSQGWERWVGDRGAIIAIDRFGASAPYKILYEQFGLTVENIVSTARDLMR